MKNGVNSAASTSFCEKVPRRALKNLSYLGESVWQPIKYPSLLSSRGTAPRTAAGKVQKHLLGELYQHKKGVKKLFMVWISIVKTHTNRLCVKKVESVAIEHKPH